MTQCKSSGGNLPPSSSGKWRWVLVPQEIILWLIDWWESGVNPKSKYDKYATSYRPDTVGHWNREILLPGTWFRLSSLGSFPQDSCCAGGLGVAAGSPWGSCYFPVWLRGHARTETNLTNIYEGNQQKENQWIGKGTSFHSIESSKKLRSLWARCSLFGLFCWNILDLQASWTGVRDHDSPATCHKDGWVVCHPPGDVKLREEKDLFPKDGHFLQRPKYVVRCLSFLTEEFHKTWNAM